MPVTITGSSGAFPNAQPKRITLAWETAGSSSVSQAFNFCGEIRRVKYVPGSGGVQPDASYDIVCTDADGVDVFSGTGANLSNSAVSEKVPSLVATDGTNSGAAPRSVNDTL